MSKTCSDLLSVAWRQVIAQSLQCSIGSVLHGSLDKGRQESTCEPTRFLVADLKRDCRPVLDRFELKDEVLPILACRGPRDGPVGFVQPDHDPGFQSSDPDLEYRLELGVFACRLARNRAQPLQALDEHFGALVVGESGKQLAGRRCYRRLSSDCLPQPRTSGMVYACADGGGPWPICQDIPPAVKYGLCREVLTMTAQTGLGHGTITVRAGGLLGVHGDTLSRISLW